MHDFVNHRTSSKHKIYFIGSYFCGGPLDHRHSSRSITALHFLKAISLYIKFYYILALGSAIVIHYNTCDIRAGILYKYVLSAAMR